MDSKTLSPHISAVIRSISLVPPSAIPAIIDCIMVSTTSSSDLSPSLFFSSLLFSFPSDPIQLRNLLSNRRGLLSHASALCHLSINYQVPADALRLLIGRIFVPVLKAMDTNDSELANEIEELLFEWICKMQSWELIGETLVPYCLKSIGLGVGMVQNDESAVFQWSNGNFLEFLGTVPLSIACRFSTSLLDRVLISWRENSTEKLQAFAANLMWDLSNLAVGMLMHSPECRSPSIRLLLPTVFKSLSLCPFKLVVNGAPYVLSRSSFASKIWKICLHMLSRGHVDRLDAYNVLSMYFSSLYSVESNENFARDNSCEEFDLRTEKGFWDEIRRGLVDKDAWMRKQALHILKASLSTYSSYVNGNDLQSSKSKSLATGSNEQAISSNGISLRANISKKGRWAEREAQSLGVGEVCCLEDGYLSSQERWKAFLLLYEMLEEYGTHLVEAAWTHQISLLFESWFSNNHVDTLSHEAYQVQMETIEGFFSWLAVLWERGFVHDNPQVRCLIMQSFLGIDWAKYRKCAQKLPRSFLLGPFILGLNDVVHHKDFGVEGIYTSRTIRDATKLFSVLSSQFSSSELAGFIWNLASIARKESFSRAGLMALCFCIASAACHSDTRDTNGKRYHMNSYSEADHVESFEEVLPHRDSDLLDALAFVIERSKQHFNPNYRLQVCEQVIKAAAFVVNGYNVSLEVLLHFLSAVPREFTDNAGPLREMVQWWLTQKNDKCTSLGFVDARELVLKNLVNFPASFLKQKHPPDDSLSFDDEDIDAWKLEAQRWVRVLFLVAKESQCLEQIFMSLQMYCGDLCKPGSRIDWVPVKLLIIIQSVVEELQIECRKFASHIESTSGEGRTRTKKFDRASFLVTCSSFEKIIGPFVVIVEEILSFSRSVSPIFWSGSMIVNSQLPCSIKGKLGGRSLRRLARSTTSALLEAIVSIQTLASMSSWFAQLKRDDHLGLSFAFTWEFSWKANQSNNYSSETGAELCLAGYEALAYVYKAWTTTFTSSVFDFIISYNKSHFPDKENLPLLDPLVHSLLQNINALLANGLLTRSRRAVLMNWKWQCVDSLLSIPYNVIQNGVHKSNAHLFFSDSVLASIFADIVENLENAGENSVLYILRSVRCVIGHLCFLNTTSAISSFAGVDCKMMQQLVHSSWILHLSCNKRRVSSIAALLSTVLHQLVFGDLRMHETSDSQQGPLKWFIGKLLDEGIKSPRTIRLAALHLTGLWLRHPKTLIYYIEELKLLSLYGSVAFDEEFEAELNENHESRTEVSLLAQSPEHELTRAFINTELYARVSVAVLFYKLADLANTQKKQEDEDFLAALHCGKIFLLELLDSAVNDKVLSKELYKKFSAVHRRKVRAWQMICVLSKFVDDDIVEDVMSKLHLCLHRNNLPAVRQYLEIFATQVYLKFPVLAERQLIPMFYDYNTRPQALSSYVLIATNVILHSSEPALQMMHLHELLPPMIPFLTSHHHSLRGFTQLLVHHVLCKLWPALEPNTSKAVPLEKKCFQDLKSYLSENVDCVRLRKSMEGFLDAFDPNTSVSPSGIFSARNKGSDFECAPISLMEHVITFLNDAREDLRNSIAKDSETIEHESLSEARTGRGVQTPSDLSLDFQKKITLHENARQVSNSASDSLLSELEMEDQLLNAAIQSRNQAMAKIRESRQQFILVASLLDRIPNLAGLARTCEIFQATGLVVADASILEDKQFQLISVTADKWVPIVEVPVSSMKVFLEKKRRDGFSILGLEQTANSTPLDKYMFPSKTVLVLGREKEGIPVDIIHILDACIEIPQLGIIRSLNVHVSGAIALWEYTRQQRCK